MEGPRHKYTPENLTKLLEKSGTLQKKDNLSPDAKNCISVNKEGKKVLYCKNNEIYLFENLHDSIKTNIRRVKCEALEFYQENAVFETIEFNPNGNFFFIQCEKSLYVAKIPSNKKESTFPSLCIGENYETAKPTIYINKVRWHPLSSDHIVVLTSDNKISMYNILQDYKKPEVSVEITVDEKSDFITSFDFMKTLGWERFTIACVSQMGKIYFVCPIIPKKCPFPKQFFSSLDTYSNIGLKRHIEELSQMEFIPNVPLVGSTKKKYVYTKQTMFHPFKVQVIGPITEYKKPKDDEEEKDKHGGKKNDFFYRRSITDIVCLHSSCFKYSSILLVNNHCFVRNLMLVDEVTPCREFKCEYLTHSTTSLQGIHPNSLPSAKNRRYDELMINPYFYKHPLFNIVYCIHNSGVHELTYDFLNFLDSDEVNFKAYFDKFYINTMLKDNTKPNPPLGFAMNFVSVDWVNTFVVDKKCFLHRFKHAFVLFNPFEGKILDDQIQYQKKEERYSEIAKKREEKEKAKEKEKDGTKVEKEKEKTATETKLEALAKVPKLVSFHEQFQSLQKNYHKLPLFLSNSKWEGEERHKLIAETYKKIDSSNVQYVKNLANLMIKRIKYISRREKLLKKTLDEYQIMMEKQMADNVSYQIRMKDIVKEQQGIDIKKDRIYVKLQSIRPLSFAEQKFGKVVKDARDSYEKWNKKVKTLEKKSGEISGEILKGRNEGEISGRFEELEKYLKETFQKIKLTQSKVEKLEKSIIDFKQQM